MLTKSKLMAWRQCPKRLWLEVNGAELAEVRTERLARGQSVGAVAREVFGGPASVLIDRSAMSLVDARRVTADLIAKRHTVFEGAFGDDELTVFADIVRPDEGGWELIEVKDAGSVKPHHLDDAAIQTAAAMRTDTPPSRISVAHLDTGWIYLGDGDYGGLFLTTDVTEEANTLALEVGAWIQAALTTLEGAEAPRRDTGRHCQTPYPCPFLAACSATEPQAMHPIDWLPGALRKDAKALFEAGVREMEDIPDDALNALQLRVKTHTVSGPSYFDQAGAEADLARCAHPLHFLDFETANPAVPIWGGTRPYAQLPFQFSLHVLSADNALEHSEFLGADGADPSRPFAEALIRSVGPDGAVIVYNAGFEVTRLRELSQRFPDLAPQLGAIAERVFDLQPVAKRRYYHPDQNGSWSIKKVLPCLAPELRYDQLEGVQDGVMAIDAYMQMIETDCDPDLWAKLDLQLRRYCRLDTLAMTAIWARFIGSDDLLTRVLAQARA